MTYVKYRYWTKRSLEIRMKMSQALGLRSKEII
jgi:hypothetical protein